MKQLIVVLAVAAFAIPTQALALDSVITPEPGTIGLMVGGLAGLGLVAWRKNRNK